MKKTFELDYPDDRMIIADIVQKTLCRHWAMPVHVSEVTREIQEPGVAHEIAMRIANYEPNDRVGADFRCRHCGTRWEFADRRQAADPANHPASCVWRWAKEYAREARA